jgi:type I restriction enzyme, S subunit
MHTVGAVVKGIEAGKSVKTLERPPVKGELAILKVSAVTWGEFRPHESKAMPPGYDPGECPRAMDGDILISRANTRELVGAPVMVCGNHPQLLLSDKLLRLVPDESIVDRRYLVRALRAPDVTQHFARCAGGTSGSMTNITQDNIRTAPLYLPPLREQRRIAAILDQADALRAKRREALAQLDSLTQSIFFEMFGDPPTSSTRWPVSRLDSLAEFFAGNSLPVGVPFERQQGGCFLMKVSDMNLLENERFVTRCQSWTDAVGARSATCPAGSVVVPKRGGAIGTNKKRITTRPTILDPNLMAIAPRNSRLNLSYLYQWFIRFDLSSIASGSSVPQLNKQDLAPLSIQVPPLALQQTFATRIQAVESLKATHRAALAESDALFASLQHRAFSGQLSS